MHESDNPSGELGRRQLLKAIAATTGYAALRIAIPAAWSAPVILSMPLPAHATMSACEAMTKGEGSLDTSSSLTVTQGADGKLTFVAKPSDAFRSNRTFYTIVERTSCTVPRGDLSYSSTIVSSVVPATNTGPLVHTVSRPAGTYDYQLRWSGGFSSWVTLRVQ